MGSRLGIRSLVLSFQKVFHQGFLCPMKLKYFWLDIFGLEKGAEFRKGIEVCGCAIGVYY